MDKPTMNLEVAAGWLQYGGLSQIHPWCIDQDGSVILHMKAGRWAMQAAAGMGRGGGVVVDCGECHSASGAFLGRFLVVRLDSFWGNDLYAVAASACTDGGDSNCGAAVLHTENQVRRLCEDIGRAMALPRDQRRGAILAAMSKWEGLNPAGWENPFRKKRGVLGKLLDRIFRRAGSVGVLPQSG